MLRRRSSRAWQVPPESRGEVVELLGGLDIFAGASRDALRSLASVSEMSDHAAGEDIIRERRIPTNFYVVQSGTLEVWSSGESGADARKINTLTDGDHFGEIGLIEGMPSTATVRSASACRLLRIPAPDFMEVVSGSPELASTLLERVAGAMARSHPSYRPAAAADHPGTVEEIIAELRSAASSLDDADRERLSEELRRLSF